MDGRMSNDIAAPESTPDNLYWLHKLEVIKCDVDGQVFSYKVEDFGDYYDGDERVLADIDTFLQRHSSSNLDLDKFLQRDIFYPVEFTLRCGVRDIGKDEHVTTLRRKKAVFIINQVIPRIYHHPNFEEWSDSISRGITGILRTIEELATVHTHDDPDDLEQLSTYFRSKEFLAAITLHIWSVCFYEQGIAFDPNETLPLLRRLAMMDCIDPVWNYAGSWGKVLALLEERHRGIQRIGGDKGLDDNSEQWRAARNSIRCQVLELAGLRRDGASTSRSAPQIFQYYPKCSAYLCLNIESSDKPHRLRCYNCHYYHWCSPACQQYSEEVAEHHAVFCNACPEEKKDQIRQQMQEFLNIPPLEGERHTLRCHSCGLVNSQDKKMHRCSKCKAVHYCSRKCQVWDWQQNDHRLKCEPPMFSSRK